MLYVIRHGETDWNLKNKIQGRADIPLNEFGIQEANLSKILLYQTNFYKIISSPLIRAKKTAEIISNQQTPVMTDIRLIERDFGEFEGKTAAELENDPDFAAFLAGTGSPRGGEDTPSFLQRSVVAFHQTVKDVLTKGETDAVICTHGGVIMAIMAAVCLERREFYEWSCGNGEGYTLRITPGLWMRSGVAELAGLIPYERADGK